MNRTDLINIAGQLRALLLENIKDVQVKFERVKGTAEERELEFSFLITGEGATHTERRERFRGRPRH